MECAAHPGTEARGACAGCGKGICEGCAIWDVDGGASCDACGRDAEVRSADIGSGLLAFVGTAYLATLALGIVVFKARPFVGGLAAVVAIALSRLLQLVLKRPIVTRRSATATLEGP